MTKTATVQAQQRWEYMELTRKTEAYLVNELNELGAVGWELVSSSFHPDTRAGAGRTPVWTAFLKRPHAGNAPSVSTEEKAASPAPPPANKPVKLKPSETTEDFDFADGEDSDDEEPAARESSAAESSAEG